MISERGELSLYSIFFFSSLFLVFFFPRRHWTLTKTQKQDENLGDTVAYSYRFIIPIIIPSSIFSFLPARSLLLLLAMSVIFLRNSASFVRVCNT